MIKARSFGKTAMFGIAVVAFACTCALVMAQAGSAHAVGVGDTFTAGGNTYKVIDYDIDDANDKGEVRLIKYGSSNKAPNINTVAYNGETFEVDEIGKGAFNNAKGHKITKVTIGRNVGMIKAKAFYGCKKLKTINMRKADVIDLERTSRGYVIDDIDAAASAFKNAGAKGVKVQCGKSNSSYKSVYKSALKSCGMKSSVKVVK